MPRKSTASATRRPVRQGTCAGPSKLLAPPLLLPGGALSRGCPSGYRGHDRDLVRVRHRRVQALTEAYVLIVQKQVDELPRLPLVVQEPPLEARKSCIQLLDGRTEISGFNRHCGLAAAQAAQGTGNTENRHCSKKLLAKPYMSTLSRNDLRLGSISARRAELPSATTSAVLRPWPVT